MRNLKTLLPLLLVVMVVGCSTGTQTGSSYSGAQTRQASVVKTGTITFVKDITISNKSVYSS